MSALATAIACVLESRAPNESMAMRAAVTASVALEAARAVEPWTPIDRAALLTTIGLAETGMRETAQLGLKRGDRGASLCVMQVHRRAWVALRPWRTADGMSESHGSVLGAGLPACMRAAGSVIDAWQGVAPWPSSDRVARLIEGYGTGADLQAAPPQWALDRAATWAAIRWQMTRGECAPLKGDES